MAEHKHAMDRLKFLKEYQQDLIKSLETIENEIKKESNKFPYSDRIFGIIEKYEKKGKHPAKIFISRELMKKLETELLTTWQVLPPYTHIYGIPVETYRSTKLEFAIPEEVIEFE